MFIETVKVALRGHPRLKYKIINAEDLQPDDELYSPDAPTEPTVPDAQAVLAEAEKAEEEAAKRVTNLEEKLSRAKSDKSKAKIVKQIDAAKVAHAEAKAKADAAYEAVAELEG